MSELKVGQKRKWYNSKNPWFEILFIGNKMAFCRYDGGSEFFHTIKELLCESTEYTEPKKKVKKKVYIAVDMRFEGEPCNWYHAGHACLKKEDCDNREWIQIVEAEIEVDEECAE